MKVSEDRLKKFWFLYVSLVISLLIQQSFISKALQIWQPSLFDSGLWLILVLAIVFYSAWQAGKADDNGKTNVFRFWIILAVLFFPWIGYFSIRIINILK